jgi:hypothetical protein
VAAAAPVCDPVFVFAPIFGTSWAFVPVRGTTVELPLELLCPATVPVGAAGLLLALVPVRSVCARLNGTIATHITIIPSLIDVTWFILFPLRPSRPLFGRRIFYSLKYPARADPRYCARGGFFSGTPEVIGAPSFEIGWSGLRQRCLDELNFAQRSCSDY